MFIEIVHHSSCFKMRHLNLLGLKSVQSRIDDLQSVTRTARTTFELIDRDARGENILYNHAQILVDHVIPYIPSRPLILLNKAFLDRNTFSQKVL